ncbi:hypothetical protein LCGC14_2808420, partial [marine sediment metagenome]
CYLRAIHEPEDLPAESIAPVGEYVSLPLDEFVPEEEEEPADTDELLRRHWQPEAFDPEGEGVTEGWPEEDWREKFKKTPPTEITELDLHSISLGRAVPHECGIAGQGHVWVKMGTAGIGECGLAVMHWGDTKCLRCGIPVPVPDFDVQEEVMLEEELPEDCCQSHSCPHHDGMRKNEKGAWYSPFYACPNYANTCHDGRCPHAVGMFRVGPSTLWRQ